jgi:DNA-binding response OmpR family regulator
MNKKSNILLIDNDDTYMTPLKTALSAAGYNVTCWQEGQKIMKLAKELKVDLFISEINLPQISGQEIFQELRSIPEFKTTPFIFLSNQKKIDERIQNIELGVDDYISKPFYVEEVVARANNLLHEISHLHDGEIETNRGFSGKLTEMNLVDLIQTLELGKKSASIKLKHNSSLGVVLISEGQVVDASLANLTSDEALMRMFTWTMGTFFVDITTVNNKRNISKTNKELVDIGTRRVSDWDQIRQGLPPLTAVVSKINANGVSELSTEEEELLASFDKKVKLCDIIEKSKYDDLKALELIRGLYEKRCLQETDDNYSHYVDDYLKRLQKNTIHSKSPSEQALSIVSSLFQESKNKEAQAERRNAERRQPFDRRKNARRRCDCMQHENAIHFTKAELLMIREALL